MHGPLTVEENIRLDAIALNQSSTFGPQKVTAFEYGDFLKREFPPRQNLLAPFLPEAGLVMCYGPRGLGKTQFAIGSAWAVASGGTFMRFSTPSGARRVLYLDGEMPAVDLQARLSREVVASGLTPPMVDYFRIAASDLVRDGLPDLSDPASQSFYAEVVADADLVVVDNLSTLCRGLRENEADSWTPVQNWCLSLRREGKSVLLIHHGGKSGAQRGTSRKEDVLDTVIGLRRPPDHSPDQGARFEVHFEKSRGFYGVKAEPFEAWLKGDQWELSEIKSGDDLDTLKALSNSGLSVRAIAERTGLSKSSVSRKLGKEE